MAKQAKREGDKAGAGAPLAALAERYFGLKQQGTDIRTEFIAGVTTFLTMVYIVFVNPVILGKAGMDTGAVFVATCLAAAASTFVMAFYANYPIALAPGMDEVSLALAADAWSRTYRSSVVSLAPSNAAIESRNGIRISPDELAGNSRVTEPMPRFSDQKPADALNQALSAIGARYGADTADIVAMQLEYPGS